MQNFWRKCTPCKKPIGFNQKYWVCSVSTCNRQRTGLVFCSIECFDSHVPVMNHRDAGAFERRSPTEAQWKAEQALATPVAPPAPAEQNLKKRVQLEESHQPAGSSRSVGVSDGESHPSENDILVVVSKVKAYIRSCSGMNTSDQVMDLLSDRIRMLADEAIRRAEQHERKTVLERDIH